MDMLVEFISFTDGLTFDSIVKLFVVMCIANCFSAVCANIVRGVRE